MSQVASQDDRRVSNVIVLGNNIVRLLACSSLFFPMEIFFNGGYQR